MLNTGAYVVKDNVTKERIAAYGTVAQAQIHAKFMGGCSVVWEKDGFTKTADAIMDRIFS